MSERNQYDHRLLQATRLGLVAKILTLKAQQATGLTRELLLVRSTLASLQQREIEDRCLMQKK